MSSPTEYRDLSITIEPDGAGGLQTRLLESPRLDYGRSLTHPFASPLTDQEVAAVLEVLASASEHRGPAAAAGSGEAPDRDLASPGQHSPPPPPPDRVALEEIGERLLSALFAGPLAEQLEASLVWCESDPRRGLRIRIVIDPECPSSAHLAAVPWELLRSHRRRSFLGRNPATPIVRHLEVERGSAPEPGKPPLGVLVAMADPSPSPSLDLAAEQRRLEDALRGHRGVEVTFLRNATVQAIRRELNENEDRYYVLHFMGHGDLDPLSGRGHLLLEDGSRQPAPLAAEELVDCLRGTSGPRLVVLNACDSGAMPRQRGIDPLMSVAAALSHVGYPAVLAMQVPIADRAAIELSAAFYQALARGQTLEAALAEARLALVASWPGSAIWAAPVLYLRGRDLTLVPPPPEPDPDQPGFEPPDNRTGPARSPELERHVISFATLIADRTRDFVGRDFVFHRIDECVRSSRGGYFLLMGEPGIGKTSVMAELVRRRDLVHHFIVHAQRSTTRISDVMPNLCAQLILDHDLPYRTLRPDAARSSCLLVELLDEIAAELPATGRLVLLLDALDEVDESELRRSGNLLDLPSNLPDKVFIVLTAQGDRSRQLPLRLESLLDKLEIPSGSAENMQDIRTYIRSFLDREHVRTYVASRCTDAESFVEELSHRCQGNFMYLRYVLEDIAQGRYLDRRPDELPFGLTNYYEDLWTRMKARGERSWFDEKLPVIAALTVAQRPVSVGFIDRALVGLGRQKIAAVLAEWQHLLRRERVETLAGQVSRFCLHHASFHQFIAAKDEVAAERVDLAEISLAIARASAAGIE